MFLAGPNLYFPSLEHSRKVCLGYLQRKGKIPILLHVILGIPSHWESRSISFSEVAWREIILLQGRNLDKLSSFGSLAQK